MATLYQATEWDTGDTITKDKMNKIEKGIETNSKEFGNYATRMELSDYIPNSAKGVSVATLENGKIPISQIPDSDTEQTISGYVKDVTSDGNATLTITTDSSPHNIKINNVENAVNAQVATKATQDKNGRDITGYLYKNENIELNSNAKIVTSGTILAILNAFCTKFKNIQGTGTYADNPPTSLQSLNNKFASMQAEGIITSDNYWVKESSGLITQFVEIEATTEEIEVPFPLAFPNKCLFVDVDVLNQEKDTSMDVKFNTIEKGLNSVKLLKIGTGTPKITVRVQGV